MIPSGYPPSIMGKKTKNQNVSVTKKKGIISSFVIMLEIWHEHSFLRMQ